MLMAWWVVLSSCFEVNSISNLLSPRFSQHAFDQTTHTLRTPRCRPRTGTHCSTISKPCLPKPFYRMKVSRARNKYIRSSPKPHSYPISTLLPQGTCEGMCSPREREERQAQQDISPFEATDATWALRRHSRILDPQVGTFERKRR